MFAVHEKELDDIRTQYSDFVEILNAHDAHRNYVVKKLKEAEDSAADKNAVRIDEKDFWEDD
ncbi:hypothetical protein FACS189461_2070 [Spirochaetia bacterium]|nr:hypothetical protein FACS189461_2070 [Spirochaetia bacterium]